jgi:putative ABC transport system permease protein
MPDRLHIRLLRFLLWLFPPSFRTRYGAGIVAAARTSSSRREAAPFRVLADAVRTLARAWYDVLANWLRMPLHPGRVFDAALRDATVALRNLRRRPLDGLVVVVTLAVALGANVAIYSVTHALLVATLPYAEPDRIMEVSSPPLRMVQIADEFSWKVGEALAEHPGVEAAATYYPEAGANLVEGSDASRVRITQISPSFFQVLGVRMQLGAGIRADAEASDRAVLSNELWRSAFGGDPDVTGRTVHLNGRAYVVAGVAPQGVDFPNGTELWLTDPPVAEFYGGAYGPTVLARLKPGATAAVEAAMRTYGESERERAGPEWASRIQDPSFTRLRDQLVAPIELPLLVLTGAAALVLLLGCVNVAGVTLARLAGRRQELDMRRALGASRSRIFGQLMSELGLVALLAGALSTVLAFQLVPLLVSMLPAGTPRIASALRPGAPMLVFAAVATLFAALVTGVPPAIAAARGRGAGHPDRVRGDDGARQRGHAALTTIQVALSVVLVVAASLLGRTLIELRAVPLGYDTERVITFEVILPEASYGSVEAAQTYLNELLLRVRSLPGVEAVGAIDRLPLSGSMGAGLNVQRPGAPERARVMAGYRRATPDLFDAMGVRILAGGTFPARSNGGAEAIISGQLARRLFGNLDPVGQRMDVSPGRGGWTATVVGVVDDVRFDGATGEIRPEFYHNLAASPRGRFSVAVRTRSEPAKLAAALRTTLMEVDPRVPPHDMRTTGAAALDVIAARRAVAIVAGLFGVAALCLALLAVYGMLAQNVAMRRQELGVRLALGAPVHSIEGLVVRRGLTHTAAGIALGLILSVNAVQFMEGMLFGVAPRDYRIMGVTALLVLCAALAASWLPARRAGRTDPMTSLRPM